jgi:hypothetical protein
VRSPTMPTTEGAIVKVGDLRDANGHPDASAIVAEFWYRNGLHSVESVASAVLALSGLSDYLARATWHRGVLPYGIDLCHFVGEMRYVVRRLDEVFDQVSSHAANLATELTAYDNNGRNPADTARQVQGGLDAARVALGPLTDALEVAHSASTHLGYDAPEPADNEGL